MHTFLIRNHKPLFYLVWLLLNLIQAGTTGLFDDEAYYWMYARFPAWGYFDHPPMVGMMIRSGYAIFSNELGLRLMTVLLSTIALWGIDSLLEKRDDRLFYAIVLGMAILQIGGIITVPDIPLMFFVVLFFLAYRRFLHRMGILETLLLGLIIALMFYSKYHGVLIVFFTLLSNPKLFSKWQTYVVGGFALVLFLPHLYWQFSNGLPSVRFHLLERNAIDYQFAFTFEYLLGQFLIAGPLIGWLLILAAWKQPPASPTERAMKWTLFGFYGLFLLSTMKGRVEANWTVPAFASLIVLSHQFLVSRPDLARWVYRLMLPSFLMVLALRVYMMIDVAPHPKIVKDEVHRNREWAVAVQQKAAGLPVVFVNSYQRPSQYSFYTGDSAFALNTIYYRRNNYNFWPLEAPLQGRRVMLFSPEDFNYYNDTVKNSRRDIGARVIDPFFSFSQVDIRSASPILARSRTITADLRFHIPAAIRNTPNYARFDTAQILLTVYYRDENPGMVIPVHASLRDVRGDSLRVQFRLPESLPAGSYRMKWSIRSAIPHVPTVNSSSYVLHNK